MLEDPSDFINEMYNTAQHVALQTISFIEKQNSNSYCNTLNYNKLSEQEKVVVTMTISDLGIRSIASPTFRHPSYADRYKYLSENTKK